jgi:peptide/nickel transport system substrate-binding protein
MKRRMLAVAAIVAASTLALSACGTGSTKAGAHDDTLTVALSTPPVSLDPAKTQGGPGSWYTQAAYGSLLNLSADGKITAGLATKWGYVGSDNKTFDLTLRSGLKFADGTPLTAKDVVKSVNYYKTGNGPSASSYRGLTLTAPNATTVHITSTEPNPLIDQLLALDNMGGEIISPAGLAHPAALAGKTFGAGPYVLDSSKSVTGDHYVYTPNKNYYDTSGIHYKTITIRVIPNVTSSVQALKSGQIDVMVGDPTIAGTIAQSSNLSLLTKPTLWTGVYLLDREGKIVPALANVKVRQALNYAVDRKAIARAAYGDYGHGQVQPAIAGFDGYDKSLESTYSYDPAKAKQLLKEAGYAKGFSIPAQYQSFDAASTKMIQAVAAQLQAVGVTLQLKGDANFGEYVNDLLSKKYAASVLNASGGNFEYFDAQFAYLPQAVLNPFGISDPKIVSGYNAIAAAPAAASGPAAQAFVKYLVDNAIALPIANVDAIFMINKKIKGFSFEKGTTNATPIISWSSN